MKPPCRQNGLKPNHARQRHIDRKLDFEMSVAARDRHQLADKETKPREPFRNDQAAQAERLIGPSHLVHVFPSFGLGGVQIRIATIMNKLGKRYRHTVIALDGCLDTRTRVDPSVDVTFKSFESPRFGLLGTLRRSRRVLRLLEPDLLLTYNWGAVEWALANGIKPVCRHIHFESGFGSEEADHQLRRRVLFRRLALARSEYLVMPSLTLVDIATNIWRIPSEKQLHIPNGVDWHRYALPSKPDALTGFERNPGELVIGTVAPLRAEKNVARLIRAFAEVSDRFPVCLVVVGDGPERLQLEDLARKLEVDAQIHFVGMVEEVESILGHFDVFALSSDTEQMPNSILQAMAAGLPVVATDVGDVAHILAPDNRRLVVERDSVSQLSSALKELLLDGSLRRKLGHCNQAHVRSHYDLAEMVEAYEKIFSA